MYIRDRDTAHTPAIDSAEVARSALDAITATELSAMGATLAGGGCNPLTGQRAVPAEHVRDIVSVMMTCGMYDAAGQWATEVGIPAKSGVSGGIVAAIPDRLGLATFSPGLDAHGNSVRGQAVFRELSERYGLHLFAVGADRLGHVERPGSLLDHRGTMTRSA